MTGRCEVLLVDDDENGRFTLAALLEDAGYRVTEAASLTQARSLLSVGSFDLAVLDVHLPDGLGPELIPELQKASPPPGIALLSGDDPTPTPGVHAYITKLGGVDELLASLEKARSRPSSA